MRRPCLFIAVAALLLLLLSACGKSEFTLTEGSDNRMTITAQNASPDSSCMTGEFFLKEGEQIEIESALTKGTVRVEVLEASGSNTGDVILKADVHLTDGASAGMHEGNYWLRATCLEKADGTIHIYVK